MIGLIVYRGYIGSVGYSIEDDCYHGKILAEYAGFGARTITLVTDLITYEGEDEAALERSFHEVVDLYVKDTDEREKQGGKQ
jgi:predicted HicB family RNase H-like nuclease